MHHHSLACRAATVALLTALGCAATNDRARAEHLESPPPQGVHSTDTELSEIAAGSRLHRGDLIAAVLQRNSTLAATRAAWDAALQRPAQETALEDPVASYEMAPLSIGSSRVDYGETVEIAQRLPWPGKRHLRGEVAARDAEVLEHDYEEMRHDVALAASYLFDDYYVAERALEINAEHVRLLHDFHEAATAQYAAGLGSQQEPIRAEVELAHLEHDDVTLRAERRVIVSRLNALLHRRPTAPLPAPSLPPEVPIELDDTLGARLEEAALTARPELASSTAEIGARHAEVELAALEGRPDFDIMTSYSSMWEDDEHRWMVGVSINLPIWRDRIRAARSEAAGRLVEAEARLRAKEDEVRASVRQAFERLREAHHIVELYQDRLLPAARDNARAVGAGVEAATEGYLALISAERELRDAELGYEKARATVQRRLALLARHVGRFPHEAAELLANLDQHATAASAGGKR